MDTIKGFFVGEYKTEVPLVPEASLRDDLWLDYLGLEELKDYLLSACPSVKEIDMEKVFTLGDLAKLLPAPKVVAVAAAPPALPASSPEALKRWFPAVIDRFKEKRQIDADKAIPMICFYHAGGMVASMRAFAKGKRREGPCCFRFTQFLQSWME